MSPRSLARGARRRYIPQNLVCRAGEEPGQLHVGDVPVQQLGRYRRRRGLVERGGQGHRPGAAGGGPVQPHRHPAGGRVGTGQQVHHPFGDDAAGERRRAVDRDDDVPGPQPAAGGGGTRQHRGEEQRRQRLLRRGLGQRRRRGGHDPQVAGHISRRQCRVEPPGVVVVQAGDHAGHGGGGQLLPLRRAGRQLAGHLLVHGGERGPVPVAVAGQRGHRGVRPVQAEPVQLLGEPGERAGQQHPVIEHRPGVVAGEHAVVGLPDGGDRGRVRRRRFRRRVGRARRRLPGGLQGMRGASRPGAARGEHDSRHCRQRRDRPSPATPGPHRRPASGGRGRTAAR